MQALEIPLKRTQSIPSSFIVITITFYWTSGAVTGEDRGEAYGGLGKIFFNPPPPKVMTKL